MGWLVKFFKGGYLPPAIDIGTHSLKVVHSEKRGSEYRLITYGSLEYEEQIFAGTEVVDSYLLADTIKEFLQKLGVEDKEVSIHIPLAACFYNVISVPTDKNPEESVMNYMQSIITPEEFSQVRIDYRILPISIEKNSIDIAIAAVKKDFLETRKQILRQAGLNPVVIDIEPAALNNQFYLNHPESTAVPVCLVDIGASFTKIVISFGGYPYVTRNLEFGGISITEQIQRKFMLSQEDAERLKRGETVQDISYDEVFSSVISSSIKKIVTETMWTIEDFKERFNLEVNTIYLFGGGAKTRGIVEAFRNLTEKEVLLGFPLGFAGISNHEEYAVAAGLSLRYKGDSDAKV